MALVYCDQPDRKLTALEDDLLVVLRPLEGVHYACEIWLGDEEPAYESRATTLAEAKLKVKRWLAEALTYESPT